MLRTKKEFYFGHIFSLGLLFFLDTGHIAFVLEPNLIPATGSLNTLEAGKTQLVRFHEKKGKVI